MITTIHQDSVEITDAAGDRMHVGPGWADLEGSRACGWMAVVAVHPNRRFDADAPSQYIALTREDAVALAAVLANLIAQADAAGAA